MALTEKQNRFCDEYLIDLNATQAAIRAGYKKGTAYSQGQRLLKNVEVQNKIALNKKTLAERVGITQERVVKELSYIAFSKASDYAKVVEKEVVKETEDGVIIPALDADGNPMTYRTVEPILTDELTEEQKRAIAVIKKGRDGFEIKPYDKLRALELLGKHLGMFKDKVELDADMELNINVDYGDEE